MELKGNMLKTQLFYDSISSAVFRTSKLSIHVATEQGGCNQAKNREEKHSVQKRILNIVSIWTLYAVQSTKDKDYSHNLF